MMESHGIPPPPGVPQGGELFPFPSLKSELETLVGMQVCSYTSIQLCKYASIHAYKYTSLSIKYAIEYLKVCKHVGMHIYAGMQVCMT